MNERMGKATRLCCALLLAVLLPACANIGLTLPSNEDLEAAVLVRVNEAGDRMVVIAVANPSESVPVLPGTTAGGYAGAPGYMAYGSARATVAALEKDYHLHQVTAWPIVALKVQCAVLEIDGAEPRDQVLATIAKDRRVQLVQPLQTFRTLGVALAYDPNYESLQRGLQEIDAPAAQRISRGDDVRVAVIDTGLDTRHPDLAGRVVMTRDFVERDKTAFNRDIHGTAVAGIIAANQNNGHGVMGVAPGAKILAFKACWQTPTADGAPDLNASACNTLTLAKALVASIEAHAQVINLSLSGPPDPLLARLVDYALQRGTIVVGAVPPSGDLHAFPVGVANVIAADLPGSKVTDAVLRAPGRDVLTLKPGGHYDFFSGSSFSAAYVSGISALLIAREPRLGATGVYAALKSSISGTDGEQTVNACVALYSIAAGACTTAMAE